MVGEAEAEADAVAVWGRGSEAAPEAEAEAAGFGCAARGENSRSYGRHRLDEQGLAGLNQAPVPSACPIFERVAE
ncbi:hypothetical protein GCM10017771_97080 [Streptomyces capitiformicae]|uniref:Uncharacterized protein n=1 Tax=Streptomyces capitiformicae TaxID=2014920 RepID=A0A918ZVT5_9ACTN|nr:hypothetical protein GCM10017771_97080 [Streptomyces capitiformicae]